MIGERTGEQVDPLGQPEQVVQGSGGNHVGDPHRQQRLPLLQREVDLPRDVGGITDGLGDDDHHHVARVDGRLDLQGPRRRPSNVVGSEPATEPVRLQMGPDLLRNAGVGLLVADEDQPWKRHRGTRLSHRLPRSFRGLKRSGSLGAGQLEAA